MKRETEREREREGKRGRERGRGERGDDVPTLLSWSKRLGFEYTSNELRC